MWARVRNRGLGFKIRRQHPIWRFIADFYCAEAKLVIEIGMKMYIATWKMH